MAISEPHVKAKARETSAITRLFPKQGKWTEEDYFALPDSNQIVELDEGVLVMPPPPDTSHQSASANLFFALESFNRKSMSALRSLRRSRFGYGMARFVNPILFSF